MSRLDNNLKTRIREPSNSIVSFNYHTNNVNCPLDNPSFVYTGGLFDCPSKARPCKRQSSRVVSEVSNNYILWFVPDVLPPQS
jgi:hypothetical protein